MYQEIAGVRIPDSKLAKESMELAQGLSNHSIFNHAFRTYVFGSLLGKKRGLKVDEELLFIGSILHDLGLTEKHFGPQRFEVEGADAAYQFLTERGLEKERADLVWDAIALHTSVGIASRKQPEIALVHLGAGVDVIGIGLDELDAELVDEVLDILPRKNFKKAIIDALIASIKANPSSAFHAFAMDVARDKIKDFACPTFAQIVAATPFAE